MICKQCGKELEKVGKAVFNLKGNKDYGLTVFHADKISIKWESGEGYMCKNGDCGLYRLLRIED